MSEQESDKSVAAETKKVEESIKRYEAFKAEQQEAIQLTEQEAKETAQQTEQVEQEAEEQKLWDVVGTATELGYSVNDHENNENNIWLTTDGRFLHTHSRRKEGGEVGVIDPIGAWAALHHYLAAYCFRHFINAVLDERAAVHPSLWHAVANDMGQIEQFIIAAKKFAAEQGHKQWYADEAEAQRAADRQKMIAQGRLIISDPI